MTTAGHAVKRQLQKAQQKHVHPAVGMMQLSSCSGKHVEHGPGWDLSSLHILTAQACAGPGEVTSAQQAMRQPVRPDL